MIRHCVLFTLHTDALPGGREEHLHAIKTRLEELPEEIPELESMEVHVNCNPAEETTFMLVADVEDLNALAIYANHPAHQQIVRELIAPYKAGRACIDYKLHDYYPH